LPITNFLLQYVVKISSEAATSAAARKNQQNLWFENFKEIHTTTVIEQAVMCIN